MGTDSTRTTAGNALIGRALSRPVLVVVVALVPAIAGASLLGLIHGATFFDFSPIASDEIYHWHQAATFDRAGLDGGYYTVSEQPAAASWSHFYVWGAFAPAFYGTLAGFSGWEFHSYVVSNVLLLTIAVLVFAQASGLDRTRLIWLGIALASYVPLLLYLPIGIEEGLQQAVALVLAACFYRLLTGTSPASSAMLLVAAFAIAAATLLRPTWGLLLLPAAVLGGRARPARTRVLLILASVSSFVLLSALFAASAAPYPHFRSEFFGLLSESIPAAFRAWARYAVHSFGALAEGETIVVGQRLQLWVLAGVFTAVAIRSLLEGADRRTGQSAFAEAAFHVYNLALVHVATVTMHESAEGQDWSVIEPHFLLSVALLVAFRRRWLLVLVIASMCVQMPAALEAYRTFSPQYDGRTQERIDGWRADLQAVMPYAPDAPSAWCNTLTHSYRYFDDGIAEPSILVAVEPGIGLSWIHRDDVPRSFRAGYLMLTDADREAFGDRLNVEPLLPVADGALYRNLDAECGIARPEP